MARVVVPLLLLLLLVVVVVWPCPAASAAGRNDPPGASSSCYKRLFSLGDSITDAGNLATSVAPNTSILAFPYGETFFRRPTGRFCDGRLIVDFIGRTPGSWSHWLAQRSSIAGAHDVILQRRRWSCRS
jgi:hypothetical protein